ncbi:MAG: putative YigZ family protein [Sphingobacteriales bacterium]|jgi:uncharacterized YigZ family protein
MLFEDTYKTIKKPATSLFKDKGSKFFGYAYPAKSEAYVKKVLAVIQNEHPKASHHCYSYRLGADGLAYRINDDGEPANTAGRPIYNQLLSSELTNIIIIVVRYFGGTLLGVSGLINAYKTTALLAIENASIVEKTVQEVYFIHFEYPQMQDVMSASKTLDLNVVDQKFEIDCILTVSVRKSKANQLFDVFGKMKNVKIKLKEVI